MGFFAVSELVTLGCLNNVALLVATLTQCFRHAFLQLVGPGGPALLRATMDRHSLGDGLLYVMIDAVLCEPCGCLFSVEIDTAVVTNDCLVLG